MCYACEMGRAERPKIVDAEFEVIKGPDAPPAIRRRRRWLTPNGSRRLLEGVEEPPKKPMSRVMRNFLIGFAIYYALYWVFFVWYEYLR